MVVKAACGGCPVGAPRGGGERLPPYLNTFKRWRRVLMPETGRRLLSWRSRSAVRVQRLVEDALLGEVVERKAGAEDRQSCHSEDLQRCVGEGIHGDRQGGRCGLQPCRLAVGAAAW
ncbi:hypothetical protein GCM10010394_48020 [Streptomyces crystallinus]|uniref:Transposase n=1 Tax=Streptomyces crystallinus TaxID=68191 RepID=A0ABP3RKW4_9ACTN